MYIFAYVCLLFALLCSLGGGGMALLQLWHGRSDHLALIKKGQILVFCSLFLASALLLHALFWEDYRLEYVSSYTDSILPVFYKLTAFWAGQPGSMLFWALVTASGGLFFHFSKAAKTLDNNVSLWFWTFFYAIMAFFCLILTCWSNPFIMQMPVPPDGNGLNPLLQNPGMILHPPLLFMGYAYFTVPACLGLAQMLCPVPNSQSWFSLTRNYIILSWVLLTAGIVLGGWWAYMELGWGGYWAWDPVENASLLPWLVATACIHVLVTAGSGKLARTAIFLMACTVIAAFFATYLTRSGVIQSVHAFGDGGVGIPLLFFVISSLVISCIISFSAPAHDEPLGSPFGREGLLVLVSWIFLALTLIILVATMWPVLSKMSQSAPQGLDASFYNRVCLPLGALLVFMLCVCTWVGWKGGFSSTSAMQKFIATLGAFCASLVALWIYDYRQPLALFAASAAIAALCAMSMHILDRKIWKNRRAFSAFGIHTGVAILAIGISFSGPYTIGEELLLSRGQKEKVGPYTITLEDVVDGSGPGYDYLKAKLKITLGNEDIGGLSPERRIYAKFGSMQFSEVDVISTLGEDIYASLYGMDEDYKVLVKISLEPLVNLIWVGGTLMCLLPLLAFGIKRRIQSQS